MVSTLTTVGLIVLYALAAGLGFAFVSNLPEKNWLMAGGFVLFAIWGTLLLLLPSPKATEDYAVFETEDDSDSSSSSSDSEQEQEDIAHNENMAFDRAMQKTNQGTGVY